MMWHKIEVIEDRKRSLALEMLLVSFQVRAMLDGVKQFLVFIFVLSLLVTIYVDENPCPHAVIGTLLTDPCPYSCHKHLDLEDLCMPHPHCLATSASASY